MLVILICVIIIFLLYGLYVKIKTDDILNPAIAFAGPIFISVIVTCIYYNTSENRVSEITYALYGLGVITFFFGLVIALEGWGIKRGNYQSIHLYYNTTMLKMFKIISALGTLLSLGHIVKGATSGTFGTNIIRNIRWYTLYIQQQSLIGKYSIIFIELTYCLYMYKFFVLDEKNSSNKKWLIISTIEYIIAITATLGRTVILAFGIETLYILLESIRIKKYQGRRKKDRRKIRALVIAVGITAFFVMQFIASKTHKSSYYNEALGRETSWIITYFGEELSVFDKYILPNPGVSNGVNTLGFFGRVFSRLGIITPDAAIDIPGGKVPSFLSGPYLDFGVVGIILVMLTQGLFVGFIYSESRRIGGYWTIIYLTCIYSCVLAFFAFQFMMSSQLYIIVLILMLMMNKHYEIKIRI